MGSELGPTEDTVSALLELLVDPLLPSVSSLAKDKAPSSAQEESVAKQVQAVVLLYDYFHRRCNPELEFLDHVSFCKLAVVLKPSLLPYMEVVNKGDDTEVDGPDKKLSLTDKMIMEACDVSKTLETSKDDVAGWPITKSAVFLVNSSKECCFLLHSSITQGVWSVIEKEHSLNFRPEGTSEEKVGRGKKRITKKPLKENRNDEAGFQQLAFAAVKDACGCSQNELEILESHTVYSLSKAKSGVRFYIMKCKRAKKEVHYVPIRDVLDSLQGPLVTKQSCSWATTSVVEYFHLLPYADILSDWFSRQPTLEATHEAGTEQEIGVQPPSDSKVEDNESEQSQNVASITNKVSAPCNMSLKEDLEAGYSSTVTKANTSQKIDTEQEISVTPVKTLVHNDRGLEVVNQIKEAPSPTRTLRSGSKLEKMKADKKAELVETVVYTKRRKTLKKDIVDDNSGCKLSKAADAECSVQKDNEISVSGLSNNMEIDEPVSSVDCSMDGKNRSCCSEDLVANELKAFVLSQNNLSSPTTDIVTKEEIVSTLQSNHEQNGENNNAQVKAVSSCQDRVQEEIVSTLQSNHDQKGENDNARVKAVSSCQDGVQANNALIPFHSNSRELDKIHKVISLRENLLSQTALKVLHRKRDMLSYQRRNIEDEIALCNRNIEAILNGSEDDLGIKLDSIIEACNSETLSGGVSDHERMYQHSHDQNTRKYLKRKRLSEANLSVQDPCQDLDDICHENYWELPTYNISTSSGGFQAAVIVKGVDFECSSRGCTCNTPREARESAASLALTKMRSMASAS